MPTTIEVRFKGNRKDYYLWPDGADRLALQQPVIVEGDRGLDFGRVGVMGETADKKCAAGCSGCAVGGNTPVPTRKLLRTASQQDIRTANDLRRSEEPTRLQTIERVRHYGLEMKVSDAEWQWDRKKLTLYFSSEKRVDFRDLVRDLATTFKTRIELRQIGVRDEAARLGGVGRCGKEYCCSTWLTSLDPISLALAKDQHLSLNPAQISGGCGRLLCCLKYEHEFYVASRKRFPKEGKMVRTIAGTEKVIAVDIFRERVLIRGEQGQRTIQLADLRDEMERAALGPPAAVDDGPAPRTEESRPPQRPRGAEPERRPERPVRQGRERPPNDGPSAARPERPPPPTPLVDAPAPTSRPKRQRRRDRRPGEERPTQTGAPPADAGPKQSAAPNDQQPSGPRPPRSKRKRRRRPGSGPAGPGTPPTPGG